MDKSVSEEPEFIYKRNVAGMFYTSACVILCVFELGCCGYYFKRNFGKDVCNDVSYMADIIGATVMLYFYLRAMLDKSYTAGSPSIQKAWPLAVRFVSAFVALILGNTDNADYFNYSKIVKYHTGLALLMIHVQGGLFIYLKNDLDTSSSWNLKPLVLIRNPEFIPNYKKVSKKHKTNTNVESK